MDGGRGGGRIEYRLSCESQITNQFRRDYAEDDFLMALTADFDGSIFTEYGIRDMNYRKSKYSKRTRWMALRDGKCNRKQGGFDTLGGFALCI